VTSQVFAIGDGFASSSSLSVVRAVFSLLTACRVDVVLVNWTCFTSNFVNVCVCVLSRNYWIIFHFLSLFSSLLFYNLDLDVCHGILR
jgi:hypothetical protein